MACAENEGGISLDRYVSETLLAIVNGVLTAQRDPNAGAYIARAPAGMAQHLSHDADGNTISLVKFDLATTHDSKMGGGIAVVPFLGIGGGAKAEAAASLVNRIGFVVAISVPRPAAQIQSDEERSRRDDATRARFTEQQSRTNY